MASRSFLLVCLCLLAVSAFALDATFPSFLKFVQQHGKQYDTMEEFQYRFTVYQENVKRIQDLRDAHFIETGEPGDFIYGITKFSDLSAAEFKGSYLGFRPSAKVFAAHTTAPVMQKPVTVEAAPTSFDWRTEGAVTPVKDQEQCGSCWAFSATEEIESTWFLANNTLIELSPQQIVSCDTVDQGCNGGDTVSAYKYVETAGGLELSKTYPYTSGNGDNGVCKYKKADVVAHISGFKYATPPCTDSCTKQDEDTLAASLLTAPVSICVDAESWQFYTSGILKSNCPSSYDQLDHCVQLVGYNFEGTTPYWIIRNSWNTDWGVEGYIWVEKGKNLCGVADESTITTI